MTVPDENRIEEIEKEIRTHHLRTLSMLASGVAHEMNNILAGLSGYYRLLQQHPDDNALRNQTLNAFHGGILRACEVVRRIGHFAGLHDPDWESIDLVPLLHDLVHTFEEDVAHVGIHIIKDFQPVPLVLADRLLVCTAILELLRNARDEVERFPQGKRGIRISTRMEDGDAVILVQDTGDGFQMPAKPVLPSPGVLEATLPFVTTKGPLAAGPLPDAKGLGLATASGIARDLHGSLTVRNHPDGGAEIRFSLPPALPLFDRRNGRVLVIDDEESSRLIMQKLLERAGYGVVTVESSHAGVEAMNETEFDLVFLDQMMPGQTGIEFLESRKKNGNSLPPVVMITAGYNTELARRALEAGAVACSTKPINRDKILYFADTYTATPRRHGFPAPTPERKPGAPSPALPPARILLVDPDALTGEAMEILLIRSGQECRRVTSGKDALHATRLEHYSLILIDMMLHDLPGTKVIRTLRLKAPYTPILVCTSRLSQTMLQHALQAGATRAIEKPIHAEEMFREIGWLTSIFREISQNDP